MLTEQHYIAWHSMKEGDKTLHSIWAMSLSFPLVFNYRKTNVKLKLWPVNICGTSIHLMLQPWNGPNAQLWREIPHRLCYLKCFFKLIRLSPLPPLIQTAYCKAIRLSPTKVKQACWKGAAQVKWDQIRFCLITQLNVSVSLQHVFMGGKVGSSCHVSCNIHCSGQQTWLGHWHF